MKANLYYVPPQQKPWQGRLDSPDKSCFFQIIQYLDFVSGTQYHFKKVTKEVPQFALVGFCCDEGIKRNQGRLGSAQGPQILRETLARLPIPKHDFVCYDAGDVICPDGNLESAQKKLGEIVFALLQNQITPIVLGGGHELAFGHYQGIESHLIKSRAEKNLGILNFDAHFDMRPLLANDLGSSGTPFLQIAQSHEKQNRRFDYNCFGIQKMGNLSHLFETAEKHQANVFLAEDIHQSQISDHLKFTDDVIQRNDFVYLSLCLDVFSCAHAPGVSAPQALGLTPWQVIPSVRKLAQSGKVISYDMAEFSPQYDQDHHTAKLACSFIYEIISSHKA